MGRRRDSARIAVAYHAAKMAKQHGHDDVEALRDGDRDDWYVKMARGYEHQLLEGFHKTKYLVEHDGTTGQVEKAAVYTSNQAAGVAFARSAAEGHYLEAPGKWQVALRYGWPGGRIPEEVNPPSVPMSHREMHRRRLVVHVHEDED